MKKISILLISILLIILNLTTIYADEISIEEVYNDKSKVIINDNESIPDGANILLISENGNYIVSVTKEERNKLNFILLILKFFISIILLSIIAFFISKIIEKSFEYRY